MQFKNYIDFQNTACQLISRLEMDEMIGTLELEQDWDEVRAEDRSRLLDMLSGHIHIDCLAMEYFHVSLSCLLRSRNIQCRIQR